MHAPLQTATEHTCIRAIREDTAVTCVTTLWRRGSGPYCLCEDGQLAHLHLGSRVGSPNPSPNPYAYPSPSGVGLRARCAG